MVLGEKGQWMTVYGCPLGATTNEDNQMIQSILEHFKQLEIKADHSLDVTAAIESLTTYKHLLVPTDG